MKIDMRAYTKSTLLISCLAFLAACDSNEPAPVAELPEHLVERFENVPLDSENVSSEFDAIFVDDQLRAATEYLSGDGLTARNLYLYFEGQPVLYRTRGFWQEASAGHQMLALAEFGLNGQSLGMTKQLDGENLPAAPHEPVAIRERALQIVAAARVIQQPLTCDFNKSLRFGETLVTVIVPVGEDCESGMVRLYARTTKGSTVRDFTRRGTVRAAWLRDFDKDGNAELLIATDHGDGEELRGWRLENGRFEILEFGELNPAQTAGFGGENLYRVDQDTLLRRFRSTDPGRGRVHLSYNWDNGRWLPEHLPPRDSLQSRIAGHWKGLFSFDLPDHGHMVIHQECGDLLFPVMALPGDLLLVSSPESAPDSCDGHAPQLRPGAWLAESNGESLRLTGLTVDERLEFSRLEPPKNGENSGSTPD